MHQAKNSATHPPPPPEPVVSWASKDHLETALPIAGWELKPQLCLSWQQPTCPWDRRAVNPHSRLQPLGLSPSKGRKVNAF